MSQNTNNQENQSAKTQVTTMTAEEFVRRFHRDINYAAETEMNEDKERDYEHRGIGAHLSLKFAASEHPEIQITDLREVLDELREGESHPVCELIYSQPVGEEVEEVEKRKPKRKAKKAKKAKAGKKADAKKTKVAKAPKVKLTPLREMSYEDFEKLLSEKGEDGVFEMYADEIRKFGEWIWREQDRGGPTYDLRSCIRMAEQELLSGLWGPRRIEV
jgi:hypothetical protein